MALTIMHAWRKGQDSNLLPSHLQCAAHPYELPFRMCRPAVLPRGGY